MVAFFQGTEGQPLVSIAGQTFSDLLHVCKDFGGTFQNSVMTSEGYPVAKVWEFDIIVGENVAKALQKVEPGILIPDFLGKNIFKDREFKRFRAAVDPSLVMSSYRGEFQKRAIQKGITQNREAIFHEMGLGKSFTIQTILNHLMEWNKIEKYIIVSPPEGIINIARECIRFSSFGLDWKDIYLVDTVHRRPFDDPEKRVIIMTYRNLIMLHNDYCKEQTGKSSSKIIRKNYIPWKAFGEKLAIVLDESHNIKSHDSRTWKIANKAKEFFEFRYIMTGTPAPKYSEDLWTQFKFLEDRCVPSEYRTFLKMIANIGNRFSEYGINYYYEDKVKEFLESVDHLVDRAKTAGNIELPDLIIDPIFCKMTTDQEQLYKTIVSNTILTLQKTNGRLTRRALKNKWGYLSLALHDPIVLKESRLDDVNADPSVALAIRRWKITDNGKYEIAESLVDKYSKEGKKIILWSGHPAIIDELAERYKKYKPYRLHGSVVVEKGESTAQRNAAIVDSFKADKDSWLLIANYMCLKTAVNLTEAPRQIWWDRDYNADTFAQAVKRSHRLGQEEKVIVNPLIFIDSMEIDQDKEIQARLQFNDDIWDKRSDKEERPDDLLTLQDCQRILVGRK